MPCSDLVGRVSQRQTNVHLLEFEVFIQEAPKESVYLRVNEITMQVESETCYLFITIKILPLLA